MAERVSVTFEVRDRAAFDAKLQKEFEQDDNIVGFRTDAPKGPYESQLRLFASAMEEKLLKNSHKRGLRELPIEALFRLLLIELEEFKVAREFLSVAEARKELVDLGNFSLILWDRLSTEDQGSKVGK